VYCVSLGEQQNVVTLLNIGEILRVKSKSLLNSQIVLREVLGLLSGVSVH